MDIRRESTNLREVYQKFVQSFSYLKDEPDAVIIAEQSEFIVINGVKFYLIRNGGSETNRTLCQDSDCTELGAKGFVALLKDHPNYPKDKQLFAYQCDECKLIYVMNIPKQKSG